MLHDANHRPSPQRTLDADALELPAPLRRYKLFEPLHEGFLVLDAAWCLLYLNPAAARILQRPRNALLRTILRQSVPEMAGTAFATELQASIESNTARAFRCYYPPSQTWLEGRAEPTEEGVCIYLQEVTDSSPERFSKAFAAAPDGMVISREADGLIHEANARFLEIFGLSREEALGQRSSDLGLFADPKDREQALVRLR